MKKQCARCGVKAKEDANLETPGLIFNYLEGCPFVCERCVSMIFEIRVEWNADIKDLLDGV